MISSPKAVAAAGDAYKRQPVGTGPWKFSAWVDNDVVSVRRNETYWQAQVALDGIDMKIIVDPNTATRSVIAGENDIAYRLFPQQKILADRSGKTQQVNFPTLAVYHIELNLSNPCFATSGCGRRSTMPSTARLSTRFRSLDWARSPPHFCRRDTGRMMICSTATTSMIRKGPETARRRRPS